MKLANYIIKPIIIQLNSKEILIQTTAYQDIDSVAEMFAKSKIEFD